MKVTLISPYDTLPNSSLRVLSAYLKQHHHKVKMVFLTQPMGIKAMDPLMDYSEKILEELARVCKGSDLVGFAVMSNYFVRVCSATKKIKELGIPIIWGGIHPTVKPVECLEHADMICIGEGEEALLEVANAIEAGKKIDNIRNIGLNVSNGTKINPVRPLEKNLDKYPFQDYDIKNHYILDGERIVRMTRDVLEKAMFIDYGRVSYLAMASRGCPHSCTYCSNNALKKIYGIKGFVRFRSPENVIEELKQAYEKYDFIEAILMVDDTFFAMPMKDMKLFCDMYKEKINLPLRCQGSPLTFNSEKLKLLLQANMFQLEIGIQSYSQKTLSDIYKRNTPKRLIDEVVNANSESGIDTNYHIIVDNPYESKEDVKESIRFIASLPKSAKVALFSLTFYPGTELYERAKKSGIIKDEVKDIYNKSIGSTSTKNWDYLTYVLYLVNRMRDINWVNGGFVKKTTELLIDDRLVSLLDRKLLLIPLSSLRKMVTNVMETWLVMKMKSEKMNGKLHKR